MFLVGDEVVAEGLAPAPGEIFTQVTFPVTDGLPVDLAWSEGAQVGPSDVAYQIIDSEGQRVVQGPIADPNFVAFAAACPTCGLPQGFIRGVGITGVHLGVLSAPPAATVALEIGAAGFAPGQGQAFGTASGLLAGESYTFTGLSAGTDYEVYGRSDCGAEDGLSDWRSFGSFTTATECPIQDPSGFTVTGDAVVLLGDPVAPNTRQTYSVYPGDVAYSPGAVVASALVAEGDSIVDGQLRVTLAGLAPDTYYRLRLRNECTDGPASEDDSAHEFTTPAVVSCGDKLTAPAPARDRFETQICPTVEGEVVSLTFNSLDLAPETILRINDGTFKQLFPGGPLPTRMSSTERDVFPRHDFVRVRPTRSIRDLTPGSSPVTRSAVLA